MKGLFNKKAMSLLLSAVFVFTMPGSTVMANESVGVEDSTEIPSGNTTSQETYYIEETPIEEIYVTETAPVVDAASYDSYTVKTTLYLRASADKTSTALATIPTGTKVYVQEETQLANGDLWGKINYTDKYKQNLTGWISLKYCTKLTTGSDTKHVAAATTEAPVTTTTEAPATTTTQAPATTTTTEPATVSTSEGETTTTTSIWAPVDGSDTSTETTTEGTKETTAAPVTVKTYVYQVTASTLNVRKGPGTSYDSIGSLTNGKQVTVTEISSNNWGKITYNGQTGWISLTYAKKLSESTETVTTTTEAAKTTTSEGQTTTTSEGQTTTTTEGTKTTTQADSSKKTYIVDASSLNMRSGPNTTYSIVGTLSNGTEVTVTEVSDNNWGKVTYNGTTGWISLAYCSETTASDTPVSTTGGWQKVNGTYTYYSNGTKLFASNTMYTAWSKIKNLYSPTSYYIVVNCSSCQLFMFKGSKGNWVPYKLWSCSPGAYGTPTVKGTFTVQDRGYSFGTYGSYTCYYWTRFYNGYLFHSVLYYWNSSKIKDGRLGMNLSHGCVRLAIDNAKFIYSYVTAGTKVLVY